MEICYSPLAGKAVNLDQVQDEMFSQRMLGDGMAVQPEAREIYSPVAGEITMVYETQHAIGIKTEGGNEILLHIGIATVMLNGDLLTIVDWNYIKEKGCDTIVPILAINHKVKLLKSKGTVKPGEALFEIEA